MPPRDERSLDLDRSAGGELERRLPLSVLAESVLALSVLPLSVLAESVLTDVPGPMTGVYR